MIPIRDSKRNRSKNAKQNLEFEILFFEGIARRDPKYIEGLQILGDAYTEMGRPGKGLQIDQQLAKLCPDSPLVFYNLACSCSLMNRLDDAFAVLKAAVKLGYADMRWLSRDPDLRNLRGDSRFARIREDVSKKSSNR